MTEYKARQLKGAIRQMERVPAGAEFSFEIIINHWSGDNERSSRMLSEGIKLLNNDYIGGSGTRGYGNIEINMDEPEEIILTHA